MGRGINRTVVAGNVTKDIGFGTTDGGDEFCSFTLVSEKKGKRKRTLLRVNIYQPGLVDLCRKRLQDGSFVVVDGELMNPDHKAGCEIRCQEIVFQ